MNLFSIRDIENLTGIKAHTLRIWEQRYNLFCPKRRESKHRFYDCEDLKHLLRIAYLYNQGHKISQIACCSPEEMAKMALEIKPDTENHEIFINQLTEASIDLDQPRFDKILHNLVLHAGFEKSVICVLFPFLKKIGVLWLTGQVVQAHAHFARSLIIKKMMVAIDGLEKPVYTGGRRVLLFTPAGDHHDMPGGECQELPLLFMHYMLKKEGVPVIYMGKNVPLSMLQLICAQQPCTQLYFLLIPNLNKCDMHEYLKEFSGMFPDKEIVFSGPEACQCSCDHLPNVRLLKTIEEKKAFLREAKVNELTS
jgi:MerR family transcriptional regulator, light-induced transcriptional regulator